MAAGNEFPLLPSVASLRHQPPILGSSSSHTIPIYTLTYRNRVGRALPSTALTVVPTRAVCLRSAAPTPERSAAAHYNSDWMTTPAGGLLCTTRR